MVEKDSKREIKAKGEIRSFKKIQGEYDIPKIYSFRLIHIRNNQELIFWKNY